MRQISIIAAVVGAFVLCMIGFTGNAADRSDPFVEKGKQFEVTVEGETVEIAKDRPKVTLNRWGGQHALVVKKSGEFAPAKRDALSAQKIQYDGQESFIVEVLKGDSLRAGATSGEEGVKIDILLHEKPTGNVFTLELEGWEDLDFFYQPDLTAEQVARGDVRPENVVGSYAVYHKTKRGHQAGGLNYKTGKLYHIYRPKIIDGSGKWVWGQLGYQSGVLSVTVPQEFLDTAQYPVRVDPTFGYSTGGGTAANIANSVGDASIRWGSAASSTAGSSTIYSLHAYLSSASGNQTVDVTMFLNRESVSDDLLTEIVRSERTGVSFTSTQEWFTFTPTSTPTIASGNYVFNAIGDGNDVTGDQIRIWYDGAGSRNSYWSYNTGASSYTNGTAAPWNVSEMPGTSEIFSMYATYGADCR